jgi:hypothetical protein
MKQKLFHLIALFVLTTLVFMPLITYRLDDSQDRGITDRVSALSYAYKIFQQQSLFHGTGIGNYPEALQNYLDTSHIPYKSWDIAPLHSAPLLVLIEWGALPSVLLLTLFTTALYAKLKKTWQYLLPLLPILFFDHYLVTQPTSLLLLVVFVVALSQLTEQEMPQSASQVKPQNVSQNYISAQRSI